MKYPYRYSLFGCIFFLIFLIACTPNKQCYVFYLHGRFLEAHSLMEKHPEYGRYEYNEIIAAFEKENVKVMSEIRPPNTHARTYAMEVNKQIDSLLAMGIQPQEITIIGASKGGYIAQYVSTFAQNPELNFVFIASYRDSDIEEIPEINFCGNILNIYEQSDPYGVSAIKRKESSKLKINAFKEVELHTGLKHGFLFKASDEWIKPCIQWAKK